MSWYFFFIYIYLFITAPPAFPLDIYIWSFVLFLFFGFWKLTSFFFFILFLSFYCHNSNGATDVGGVVVDVDGVVMIITMSEWYSADSSGFTVPWTGHFGSGEEPNQHFLSLSLFFSLSLPLLFFIFHPILLSVSFFPYPPIDPPIHPLLAPHYNNLIGKTGMEILTEFGCLESDVAQIVASMRVNLKFGSNSLI